MDLITLLAVAVALGTDAFSLALGMGLTGLRRKEALLFPAIVAAFHVAMPLIGMYAGRLLGDVFGEIAGVIGGAILLFIGGRTLIRSLKNKEVETIPFNKAKQSLKKSFRNRSITGLFVLATGVSLDALSVGFGLGTLGAQLALAVLVMGVVAGTMTGLGLLLGRSLGEWIGKHAESVGGLILLIIGLKIMV